MPARDAWVFAHNALVGTGLRGSIRVFTGGKILTGFHMVRAQALGADACNSAWGFVFALGCIRALRCNTGRCPTGAATQRPDLVAGLVVERKRTRVADFHRGTMRIFCELQGPMGFEDPAALGPRHVFRRLAEVRVRSFAELQESLEDGSLLHGRAPEAWLRRSDHARAQRSD